MSLELDDVKQNVIELKADGYSSREISELTGISKSSINSFLAGDTYKDWWEGKLVPAASSNPQEGGARVLVFDIETSQMLLGGWGLFNQNYSIDQIEEDWHLISYSAKWLNNDQVLENDVSKVSEQELLQELHNLLDEADFAIAHNGRRFDIKKVKARMIQHGFKPFSPCRIIDTLEIAKKEFGFTSNKLAYLTRELCKTNIKSSHAKFPGYLLWKEFKKGNPEAIKEMADYNIIDVTSLEELYFLLAPWSSTLPNFDVYVDECVDMSVWEHVGYFYSNLGKYDKYRHVETGHYRRGRVNHLSKGKRAQLLGNIIS